MKKEAMRAEKVKILFAQNPSVKSFHMTSDDQAFLQKNDAQNHAKTLEDKKVDEVFKNSSLMDEGSLEITDAGLQKMANAAGLTDEAGNLVPSDETVNVEKPAAAAKKDAVKKAAAKPAAKPAKKDVTKVAEEPIKPEVKKDEAVVDATGGTDAK
jgi:hypothetical protein